MAGWEQAAQVRDETRSSGGVYVRLEDGDHIEVVLGTDIATYREVWNASERRSERYDETRHDGMRPRTKFIVPMLVREGAREYAARVFNASGQAFDALKEGVDEYGLDTVFKLKRSGSGKDTSYSLLFKRRLEGAEAEHVATLSQLDPEAVLNGAESGNDDTPTASDDGGWGDAPF